MSRIKMIRIKHLIVVSALFLSTVFCFAASDLILVEKWEHNDEILQRVTGSFIDDDGDVIICVFREGARLVAPKKVVKFARFGKANHQIEDFKAIDSYPGQGIKNRGIAILERVDRLKIFKKKDGTYKETGVKWLTRNRYPHFIKNGVYIGKKWFLAGRCLMNFHPTILKQSLIRVLDDNGKPAGTILHEETKQDENAKGFYAEYLITANRARRELYFMREYEMKITVISPGDMKVKRTVRLEKPKHYTPMPSHFYQRIKTDPRGPGVLKKIETWKTGYSRINEADCYGDYLVLQLVNCRENGKNYMLLFYKFYKGADFKLEKVVPTDDLFLGVHGDKLGDKLYFFAGGNPGYNEGVDRVGIHIYRYGPVGKK